MKLKRFFSILLVFCMMISLMPTMTFADDPWAYVIKADGKKTTYSTFIDAWNAAVASDKSTVGLLKSWDGGRFVVPEGKTLTLELNGNVLTRNLGDQKSDGEVLYVSKNATLYVYGGNKEDPSFGSDISHSVNVYVANADRYGYTRQKETLYGGIINGGNSSDAGGGIHMKEKGKTYLYNVTVAGNRAGAKTVEFGDGGGIEMDESYCYLYMQDSQVIYNCARYDGGGVHVDQSYCRIEMVRSRIDHNVADDNGGGIYVDGNNFSLKGDAKQIMDPEGAISKYGINDWNGAYNYFPPVEEIGSSVSYNCVFDAEDGGGGIYCDNETELIEGVNIFGNIAINTDDADHGGGIYLNEEEMTVRNCNIFRNKADKYGGGIYNRGDDNIVDLDDNKVENCSIVMNVARATGGAGGGIYVYRYCDLAVSGPVIVRGNVSNGLDADNLYLSSDGAAVNAYLLPATSPGADVHVRTSEWGAEHNGRISRDAGSYDIQHFAYDNDSNKHIGWDSDWDDRVLKVVDGKKPAMAQATVFTPDEGKRVRVLEDKYNGYELIKGIVSYPSFPDDSADIENVFYYSDGFFAGDTNTYNPQLGTLSMCLAGAAGYSNEYGKDDSEGDYLDKSQNFRQFVSDIGCKDESIYVNDFNLQKPDADTIGVGIASKDIALEGVTKKLVIIGVRGMGYEKEWISNLTLGAEGEAAGWSSAATQVMAELDGYLSRKGIDGSSDDTIFWIAGYSRAGATANLTAKRIVDKYDNQGTHTFAYPLEAPKGGVSSEAVAGNNYNCIHNIINNNDIVPWAGTTEMGFIRYGVDHYVPGSTDISDNPTDRSDANQVPVQNNIPEDNVPWDVENTVHKGYSAQKTKMLKQLTAVNQDILFDDYYQQATINFVNGGYFHSVDLITETSSHEDQMGTTEHFIAFFFKYLQEYAFRFKINGSAVDEKYKNPRAYFAEFEVADHRTFQQAAAAMAGIVFGKSDDDVAGVMDCLGSLMNRADLYSIYCNIDDDDIDDLSGEIDKLWKLLSNVSEKEEAKGYRKIQDFLTGKEYTEIKSSIKSLLFPLLCFASGDYSKWDSDILGSMGYNIFRIIANHYPEVTHSWLRSYDYLYENDTTPVVMDTNVKTEPSAASLVISHGDGSEDTVVILDGAKTGDNAIKVKKDDKVRMIPSNSADVDAGEAIYYQFTDGPLYFDRSPHVYHDPIAINDLFWNYSTSGGVVYLQVASAHNGIKEEWVPVHLVLDGSAYISFPFTYKNDEIIYIESPIEQNRYQTISTEVLIEEEPYVIDLAEDIGKVFMGWKAYEYFPTGEYFEPGTLGEEISPDKYHVYFGSGFDANSKETRAVNVQGINARFVPVFENAIDADLVFEGEVEGLPVIAEWATDGGIYSKEDYAILWTYDETYDQYIATVSFRINDDEHFRLKNIRFEDPDIDYQVEIADTEPQVMTNSALGDKIETIIVRFNPKTKGTTGSLIANSDYYENFFTCDANQYNKIIDSYRVAVEKTSNIYYLFAEYLYVPFVEDMQLTHLVVSGNEVTDNNVTRFYKGGISACYKPEVHAIEVTLDKPLKAKEPMPVMKQTVVTVTNPNHWRIDNAEFKWDSTDETARYETVYTASVTVDLENLMGTKLDDKSGKSDALAGLFTFADDLNITVVDSEGNTINATSRLDVSESQAVLYLTFDTTEDRPEEDKLSIVRFEDINIIVPHGSGSEYILGQLPTEANAYLEDGRMVSVPVEWSSVETPDASEVGAQVVTASGNYVGSDYIIAEGVNLTADVIVEEAERTSMPTATPGTGNYTGLQVIDLTADEGATIYYAIQTFTEGEYYIIETDPATGEEISRKVKPKLPKPAAEDYQPYTEPIKLTQYGNVIVLYTFAEKEGLRNSGVINYNYELTKPEVKKLEAKAPTIAENGNIECWYSYKTKDDVVIPVEYYADENCTERLDYKTQVLRPAYIASSYPAAADDEIAKCIMENEYEPVVMSGFETLGVQSIGTDGAAARVLTVLDSRILVPSTDYGYLFGSSDASLTYDTASYKYSCKNTSNTLYSGDYSYVTAKIANGFLDSEMKACFYVKLENGTDYIYTDAVACEATIERTESTDGATDNITVDKEIPKFKTHALLLSGQIGVNFYMDLSMLTAAEQQAVYMEFTLNGKTTTDTFDASCTNPSTGTLYGFTCYINSVQMADEITAILHYTMDGEEGTISQTYTAKDYINHVLSNTGDYSTNTVALVSSIADYGHYVQPFLADTNHWTIGEDHAVMDGVSDLGVMDVENARTAVENAAIVRETGDSQIEKVTYALNLESETAIRIYLKVKDGYTGLVTATMDGNSIDCIKQKDGRYCIEIGGISAHKLGTVYNVKVTAGADFTVSVSALSYVNTVLNSDSDLFNNDKAHFAVTSLYNYYASTMKYRNNPND